MTVTFVFKFGQFPRKRGSFLCPLRYCSVGKDRFGISSHSLDGYHVKDSQKSNGKCIPATSNIEMYFLFHVVVQRRCVLMLGSPCDSGPYQ